jgi:hypothetical protein
MSAIIVLGLAPQPDALREPLSREHKTGYVARRVCEFAQSVEQPQGMKHGRVDSDADAGASLLDPL